MAAVRPALCGVTVAALVAVSGCGGGDSKPKAGGGTTAGAAAPTSSPTVTPQSVAQSFLDAWASGDYAKAASFTDAPDKAAAGLKNEMAALAPQKVTLTLGQQADPSSSAATAPASSSGTTPATAGSPASSPSSAAPAVARYSFAVSDDFGNNLQWQYQSALNLVQGSSGAPVVHWSYGVIHPSLTSVALLKAAPPKVTVTDSTGAKIDTKAHPSLLNAVNSLSTKLPPGQTPQSLTVEFTDANTGAQIQGSQSFQIGAATTAPITVKTTLKPAVQSAMEAALKDYPNSAMVAIQPSTGNILGMASNAPGNLSMAYKATRAPGSTFKVLTTALALQKGLKIDDPVNCSANATVEGQVINNDKDLAAGIQNASLKQAFLQSCNTAFVHLALDGKLGSDYTALSTEAKDYFGLNQKWDLGMGAATYGAVGDQQVPPADGKGLFARDAFGQGNLSMSPLVMASVAATVAAHQFHQPVLVPGVTTVSATPLPDAVAQQLTTLMQGVATSGTAAGVFPGLTGIAAKTGSAESNDTAKTGKTDSWMVAFDPNHDIAFAALVLNGGFGRDAAGPAINKVLHSPGVR
ncbi:penicillin-binding transpeptidase domain-containing protein [Catenulispora subtropica]|uniref:Penicillin-binding transpeptidase domain-containing protein n=2 Tax=Catenulispora subtropica TaxID=450798 RepID=A0ABP5EUS6_9ACTN